MHHFFEWMYVCTCVYCFCCGTLYVAHLTAYMGQLGQNNMGQYTTLSISTQESTGPILVPVGAPASQSTGLHNNHRMGPKHRSHRDSRESASRCEKATLWCESTRRLPLSKVKATMQVEGSKQVIRRVCLDHFIFCVFVREFIIFKLLNVD